jgi:hypothetical protein
MLPCAALWLLLGLTGGSHGRYASEVWGAPLNDCFHMTVSRQSLGRKAIIGPSAVVLACALTSVCIRLQQFSGVYRSELVFATFVVHVLTRLPTFLTEILMSFSTLFLVEFRYLVIEQPRFPALYTLHIQHTQFFNAARFSVRASDRTFVSVTLCVFTHTSNNQTMTPDTQNCIVTSLFSGHNTIAAMLNGTQHDELCNLRPWAVPVTACSSSFAGIRKGRTPAETPCFVEERPLHNFTQYLHFLTCFDMQMTPFFP